MPYLVRICAIAVIMAVLFALSIAVPYVDAGANPCPNDECRLRDKERDTEAE